MVGCRPTQRPLKLHSLWDSKKSRMRQYTTQTCSPGPDDQSLTDTGGGYHLRAPNMKTYLSPTVPSGIVHNPLVCPARSQFEPFYQLFKFSTHSNLKPGYKKHITTNGIRLLPEFYPLSISLLMEFHHDRIKGATKRVVMQSRVSINAYNVNAL
jgi:hypothetical protein